MVALILADGDAPIPADLDEAWPGWADDVGLVVAADGGARHAAGLGPCHRPLGRRWRLDRRGGRSARLRAGGVAVDLVATDKDETDTELAVGAALDRGRRRGSSSSARPAGQRIDHALANIGAAGHPRARRPSTSGSTPRRPGSGSLTAPDADGRRSPCGSTGGSATSSRSCRSAATSMASRPATCATRCVTRPSPLGPPRGLSNVVDAAVAASSVSDAAGCSSSSRPLPSAHEHARPSATPPRRSPCRTRPAPSTT